MKKYFKILTAGALLLSFSSCLKDKGFDNGEYGMENDNGEHFAAFVKSYEKDGNNVVGILTSPVEESFTFAQLTITGEDIKKDVTVTMVLDNSIITAFNTANGTSYLPLPAAAYEMPLTVTIPRGTQFYPVMLKLKKGALDATKAYALAVKITGTSDPSVKLSTNSNQRMITFLIKNKYDGNYELTIKTVGWAAYGISDNMPDTWPSNSDGTSIGMVTVGANAVKLFDYWGFNAYIQPAFTTNNAGATGFGATEPKFIFDLATDKLLDVVNDAVPDSRNRQFRLNPAVTDSRFDDATRTIYAAYILSQTGRPDQLIFDTLHYVSPRP